jgi:hypothetical protein
MEDILEIYRRPYDPMRPLVCMDESTKQLLDEIRSPIPSRIGAPQRYDSEYRRNGVAQLVPGLRASGRMAPGSGH